MSVMTTNGHGPDAVLPPHSLDAERSVLGAILLAGDQVLEPIAHEERLRTEHFYRDQHRLIFAAMLALHQRREPIDILTVNAQLKEHGTLETAGGEAAVDALAGWVPAAGNSRAYARIVRDHAIRRQVLLAAYEIQQRAAAGEGDVEALTADATKLIGDVLEQSLPPGSRHMHEALWDRAEELRLLAKQPNALIGLPTGLPRVDQALKGMRPGELIVLAARPAAGKSALGQQIAIHNAVKGHGTLLVSLEMSEAELADRHFASCGEVPYGRVRAVRDLDEAQLKRIDAQATRWATDTPPLVVCDRAPMTMSELRSEALRWRRRLPGGLQLVIVDYLQLLSHERNERFTNRYEIVSELSRRMKMLAKELAVPVLAIAQLSRESERRPDKRPQLSDLRDSGALEQDANTVLLLHRADRYDEEAEPGVTEVIIAKARNAECTTLALDFEGTFQRFRARG